MTSLAGIPVAPGVAHGPAWRHREHPTTAASGSQAPLTVEQLQALAERAARDLEALAERLRASDRAQEAAIFDAQALMVTDPALIDDSTRRIAAGAPAATAVHEAAEAAAAALASLDNELLAARAADVRDVGARLARLVSDHRLELPTAPSIAVADDLPPSITAEIAPGMLLGIVLQEGSPTAHAAILARSLGIPAVMGVSGLLEAIEDAGVTADLAIDGTTGEVLLDPLPGDLARLESRRAGAGVIAERARAVRDRPASLADGERVTLLANWSSERDTAQALEVRAEGVGLYRTEFLFTGRSSTPSEAEQIEAYGAVFRAFGERPVVIRLADIGGDKQIPYLELPPESNPFLGVRALRLAARHRAMLVTQLRAISVAGALARVVPHVMAPMVSTIEDVELLHQLRDEAQASLASEGRPHAERIVTGIMVEVPSAALMSAELAPLVDFFSIGTNDLTQYIMAADRTNPDLANLQEALHPAVLRAIAMVVAGADAVGIPVAVCGELAGDPAGALVLVGLGVDELSAGPGSLDALRLHLASVTRAELDVLARQALAAHSGADVRALAAPLLARAE
ncbi:MAG: phosphoenolpyruvate--protein phosphotransferase, partial [Chloroflexi bacterium]|nr:phosphoenolpyruvate--protein phosphotransferase [Chloroflexota bacterium]